MKKNGLIAGALAVLFTFASVSCANSVAEEIPATPSLQDVITTTEKTSVDLSNEVFELADNSEIVITKAITLTGGSSKYDFKGATVKVKTSGARLENVTNIKELIIDEAVGDGDVTVKNCDIETLTVNGGGANSIHIEDVVVKQVAVAKEGVRLVLEGASSVASVEVKAKCVLDSSSTSAKISNVKVEAAVKNIEIKGQMKIEKLVASSTEFKVTISSNDVKVEAAVVKTADGKTAKVTVEAAEGITVKEIPQPADEEEEQEDETEKGDADNPNPVFSYKYEPLHAVYSVTGVPQEEVPQWVINTITLEDCEDGVKFVFHKPSETDCPDSYRMVWIDAHHIDSNMNENVGVSPKESVIEAFNNGETETLEFSFPFVLPGKTVSLCIQYGYATPNYAEYKEVRLYYTVNTAHGKAMVDELPENFDDSDYVTIKDGRYLEIQNITLPKGKNYRSIIQVFEYDPNVTTDPNQIGYKESPDHTPETNDKYDLIDFCEIEKRYPYIYAILHYEFELDEYPNIYTRCHMYTTQKYENVFKGSAFFVNANKAEKVSDTEYKTSAQWFKALLKALEDEGDLFTITLTDTPDAGKFFGEICWEDMNDVPNYVLDLSQTELTYIPGWNTGNQIYNGGNGTKIVGVILPNTIEKIDDGAFYETSIKSIEIPASVKWIGKTILPNSAYSDEWAEIIQSNKSEWYGYDGGGADDDAKAELLRRWNNRVIEGATPLVNEPGGLFFQWSRYFRVE